MHLRCRTCADVRGDGFEGGGTLTCGCCIGGADVTGDGFAGGGIHISVRLLYEFWVGACDFTGFFGFWKISSI